MAGASHRDYVSRCAHVLACKMLTRYRYDQDGAGVNYPLFLRALHSYAKAEMRFGR